MREWEEVEGGYVMKYNLTVDWDQVQHIIVDALKEDYDNLKKSSEALERLSVSDTFLDIQKEDLKYELEVKNALRTVINYYSKPQDWIDE